jgi:hypothetical protein
MLTIENESRFCNNAPAKTTVGLLSHPFLFLFFTPSRLRTPVLFACFPNDLLRRNRDPSFQIHQSALGRRAVLYSRCTSLSIQIYPTLPLRQGWLGNGSLRWSTSSKNRRPESMHERRSSSDPQMRWRWKNPGVLQTRFGALLPPSPSRTFVSSSCTDTQTQLAANSTLSSPQVYRATRDQGSRHRNPAGRVDAHG